MLISFKRIISLITLMSLIGLFLTACSQSSGTENVAPDGNSVSRASATPTVSPNSNISMSNMEVPARSTKDSRKNTQEAAGANQVVIENFSFAPATLTVKAGTSVTWVNHDDIPHTVYGTDKRFKSSAMDTDDKFSFTFKSPGTYNYFCSLHPRMTGQIIVK